MIFFFFKQKTAYELRISDWSSDVCSSDLQWLNYVRTGRARSEIRHYLRTVKYEESIAFGLRLLNQAFDQLHLPHPAEDDLEWEKRPKVPAPSPPLESLAIHGRGKSRAQFVASPLPLESPYLATTAPAADQTTPPPNAPTPIQRNKRPPVIGAHFAA